MIILNPNACTIIEAIHKRDANNLSPDIGDIFTLLGLFNTHNVNCPVLGKSTAYWEFIRACLDNIEKHTWVTLPRMWLEYICATHDMVLTPSQIQEEYYYYLQYRKEVLTRLKLTICPTMDSEVRLHWIRAHKGEQYIIGVANTLSRAYMYFLEQQQGHKEFNSINAADQSSPPTEGNNAYEIVTWHLSKHKQRDNAHNLI